MQNFINYNTLGLIELQVRFQTVTLQAVWLRMNKKSIFPNVQIVNFCSTEAIVDLSELITFDLEKRRYPLIHIYLFLTIID